MIRRHRCRRRGRSEIGLVPACFGVNLSLEIVRCERGLTYIGRLE